MYDRELKKVQANSTNSMHERATMQRTRANWKYSSRTANIRQYIYTTHQYPSIYQRVLPTTAKASSSLCSATSSYYDNQGILNWAEKDEGIHLVRDFWNSFWSYESMCPR
jgi:hypothetical protein